jgi:transcription antitermination factor NusG
MNPIPQSLSVVPEGSITLSQNAPCAPVDSHELNWYATYTCAKHEKRVAGQLLQRSVEAFLPEYESLRRWKDRKVKLQLPLFPGYVFVRLALRDRLRVLEIPGVVRLVGFNGSPSAIQDEEIRALQLMMAAGVHPQPHSYLRSGDRVRIIRGPLAGIEGIVVRRKNAVRIVLSLNLIARSAAVEVSAEDIDKIQ